MKKFRKLIPALCLLLISAMMLGTSTFAWFSMNNTVTVTGMAVTTKVDNNLLIAPAHATATTKSADSAFKNAYHSEVVGTLQPSSTIDGVSYYYTYDAAANGAIIDNMSFKEVSNNTITINSTNYKAYVDYAFEVKAVNAGSADAYVNLSKVNLLYEGAPATDGGYRVAVFVQKQVDPSATLLAAETAEAYKSMPTTADSILGWDSNGASYFSAKNAVSGTAYNAKSEVVNYAQQTSLSVAANSTQYFKFTIRLWLEGEDKKTTNDTYMTLTNKWTLDLALTFDSSNTAVAQIGSIANAIVNSSGLTGTVTVDSNNVIANNETVKSFAWKTAAGANAVGSGANTNSFTATEAGDYYCEITTTKGNIYRTAIVHLA